MADNIQAAMAEPDLVAKFEATLNLLEPISTLKPPDNPDARYINQAVAELASAHATGKALTTGRLTTALIGILQLLHSSGTAALRSLKKPPSLLQAAATSGQVQECRDVTEQCKAALARTEAERTKLQQQLSELQQDKAQLTAQWREVVRGHKARAAQPATQTSTQLVRITRSFPSDLTPSKAIEAASAVLTGLGVHAGAVLQVSIEYPGGDRKSAPRALVVTVSAATFTYLFAPEQRQALQQLSDNGTRVCGHLTPIEHACRKALYSKYTAQHPAAEAGPAEGRPKLPSHRFADDYTTVTFHPRATREEQVVLRLSKEEVEAFRTKPGKGPARMQA